MTEENLFVYVECPSVRHASSRFSVRKNVTKKNKEKKVKMKKKKKGNERE